MKEPSGGKLSQPSEGANPTDRVEGFSAMSATTENKSEEAHVFNELPADTIVWRYMETWKLKPILNNQLWFARPWTFEDDWEGRLPQWFIDNARKRAKSALGQIKVSGTNSELVPETFSPA
jgi:hypothetical protein